MKIKVLNFHLHWSKKEAKVADYFFIYSCDVQMHLSYMKAQCSLLAAAATLKLADSKNLSL